MDKNTNIIETFLGRCLEVGSVSIIKCNDCKSKTISVSMDKDEELMCEVCESQNINIQQLNN